MCYKPCLNGYIGIKEVIKLYNRNIKRSQSFLHNVIDIAKFEQISNIVLGFLLLTLNK